MALQEITVTASRSYQVHIENGSLGKLGSLVRSVHPPCTAAIVSDDTVFALYGHPVCASLRESGFSPISFVFPHGEGQKNWDTLGALLNFLCDSHLTRSDCIIALGGGVVGDMAGFAAAVYQRGIPYVQVPTTLLSMVDSSVGGKTAVDLDGGKNQAGCFWQPSLVVCDPDVLSTLPEEQYRSGCGEVIKYGLLGDASLFRTLRDMPVSMQYASVIARCVEMKRDIVEADELDRGQRQTLNLGHTVGHAIEAASGYTVPHGEAVAIGMAVITRAAAAKGICTAGTAAEVVALLRQYGLPTETGYGKAALLAAAEQDKKRSGNTIRLIVPEAIGQCRVEPISLSSLGGWLEAGGIR